MRLKSFQAKSMTEVMRQIKDALGDDAIIVSSHEEASGWVRVTAAVEIMPSQQEVAPVQDNTEFGADTFIEDITDALLRHRVPAVVSDKIISAASSNIEQTVHETMTAALRTVFKFGDLLPDTPRPMMLVGPPGAGKTLMTAKLAAESVLNGQHPTIITTDIARAGGIEQLTAFLDILALPLLQAEDSKTLKRLLNNAAESPLVIVDTGGLNPFDPQEMKELAKLLAVGQMDPALVLPAGLDAEEAAEIALTFQILGVKKIVPTRLDFARRLGGILSAADKADLTFTEASHTPKVANGIVRLSADRLAEILLPASRKGTKS